MILGNSKSTLRQYCRRKADWGAGDLKLNEQVVWIPSKLIVTEDEHADLERALLDLGLKTIISEDLEDLHLLLTRIEPVLLLLELRKSEGWPGWEIISTIREEGRILPIMVISGDGSSNGAVTAFQSGGNEYMSRPLHIEEFKCRIRNLLELTGKRRGLGNLLRVDGLIIDPSSRLVSREGKEIKMTPKEFELLYYLAGNLGHICPRDEILKKVWGYHFHTSTNVVDVYIRHIRAKVDKGHRNKLIHTVRGTGYVLKAPITAPHADPNSLS